jgi:hypothetical protein
VTGAACQVVIHHEKGGRRVLVDAAVPWRQSWWVAAAGAVTTGERGAGLGAVLAAQAALDRFEG